MNKIEKSLEWYGKAKQLIPWGTQTGAKDPAIFAEYMGVCPLYFERGKGSHVWDIDGNEYIDYRASLGPIILGYAYEPVDRAVKDRIDKGIIFSMASTLELELAKRIVDIIPCAEMVRFMKTGGDANSAAVRLARAYTGKEKILKCGYHGWHDTFIAAEKAENKGIPAILSDYVTSFPYNDIDCARDLIIKNADELACIVINPCPYQLPEKNFLSELKELAHKHNILLIFDEVKTGFRLSLGGAQEFFGVEPDLAVFSKAMANGYPISAFTGKRHIMSILDQNKQGTHFIPISTTFAGETASIAAAIATIDVMRNKDVHLHLGKAGRMLMNGMQSIFNEFSMEVEIEGVPSMFRTKIKGSEALNTTFISELLKNGIFTLGAWEVSYSHSEEDIANTLQIIRDILRVM